MRRIQAEEALTDEETKELAGELLTDAHYDTLISGEDVEVLKPDGSPLIQFRHKVLTPSKCSAAYKGLRKAAAESDNRGVAAGLIEKDDPALLQMMEQEGATDIVYSAGKTRYRMVTATGYVSNTQRAKRVRSGIVGFFDRNPRLPYCRMTAFNMREPEKFASAVPVIQECDRVFAEAVPERYAFQKEFAERTSSDFLIPQTAFSTVTVNRNWQTAVHKDAGDLKGGFGCLTAFSAGEYDGCYLIFPKFRVAANIRSGDVCLADVHEWHGNSPIRRNTRAYDRVSLVLYYRERMAECGSAVEELSRAKNLERNRLVVEVESATD